jgi:hypothetical protein
MRAGSPIPPAEHHFNFLPSSGSLVADGKEVQELDHNSAGSCCDIFIWKDVLLYNILLEMANRGARVHRLHIVFPSRRDNKNLQTHAVCTLGSRNVSFQLAHHFLCPTSRPGRKMATARQKERFNCSHRLEKSLESECESQRAPHANNLEQL